MPGGNGMGPMGQGPMSGRGMGWCRGANTSDSTGQNEAGYGMGRGGGRGNGWRHRHGFRTSGLPGWLRAWMGAFGGSTPSPRDLNSNLSDKQELEILKQKADTLERALGEIRARIQDVEAPPEGASKS